MKAFLHAAAPAILLATSNPATAQDSGRQLAVSYGDLDLTRSEGAERLKQRVHAAVQAVCRTDDASLKQQLRQRACTKKSAAVASDQVVRAIGRANRAQTYAHVPQTVLVAR